MCDKKGFPIFIHNLSTIVEASFFQKPTWRQPWRQLKGLVKEGSSLTNPGVASHASDPTAADL
jgi:hypothetical protein